MDNGRLRSYSLELFKFYLVRSLNLHIMELCETIACNLGCTRSNKGEARLLPESNTGWSLSSPSIILRARLVLLLKKGVLYFRISVVPQVLSSLALNSP